MEKRPGSNPRRRANGGPRTLLGKARSSQNARKHGILAARILPEEKKRAAALFDSVCEEFHPTGQMELEITARLVLNLLQGRRIDAYAAAEFEKARIQSTTSWNKDLERSMAAYWQHERGSRDPSGTRNSGRLPPRAIVAILTELKEKVETRGLDPADDIDLMNNAYGEDKSACAAIILRIYTDVQNDPSLNANEGARKSVLAECQSRVLSAMATEIQRQSDIAASQHSIDVLTRAVDMLLPPPAAVMDLIERYREGNLREQSRLLQVLHQVRELKAQALVRPRPLHRGQ